MEAGPLRKGDVLDCYRIEAQLGSGGMGFVYAARNEQTELKVAIKVLKGIQSPAHAARFQNEARMLADIRSDHVARIIDFRRDTVPSCSTTGGEAEVPYLVMEYLPGEDLWSLLRKLREQGRGPLEPAVATQWALEACEALAHAHSRDIVHRDLKPSNLFLEQKLDGSKRVKLIDFGIAKMPSAETLTNSNEPIGSPMYMSPEQWDGAPDIDTRADVWSLGVVLYEMLTLEVPFSGQTKFELRDRICDEPHRPLTDVRPELPLELEQVLDRCFEKNRDRRWPDVSTLAVALGPFAPASAADLITAVGNICSPAKTTSLTAQASGEGPDHQRDPGVRALPPSARRALRHWRWAAITIATAAVGLLGTWHYVEPKAAAIVEPSASQSVKALTSAPPAPHLEASAAPESAASRVDAAPASAPRQTPMSNDAAPSARVEPLRASASEPAPASKLPSTAGRAPRPRRSVNEQTGQAAMTPPRTAIPLPTAQRKSDTKPDVSRPLTMESRRNLTRSIMRLKVAGPAKSQQ